MRIMFTLTTALLLAATTVAEPPDAKTGLQVGEKAPAFTLKDQHGKERSLEEFTKKGTVAIIFHRSANW